MARINARVGQEYIDKLEVLKSQQQCSVTQVLKQAIDDYYDAYVSAAQSQSRAILNGGFIACGEGDEDLSESYKGYLSESLKEKHDYR